MSKPDEFKNCRIIRTMNGQGLNANIDPDDGWVLTFTPKTSEFLHYHIALNEAQAKRLRDWLVANLPKGMA